MSPRLRVALLAVGFDIYWTLVVLLRDRGEFVWFALAIVACGILPARQRILAVTLTLAGCLLDSLWLITGLVLFEGSQFLPLWMMSLWLMFASVWTHLMFITTLPLWLMTLLATIGGPAAYAIGQHAGAMVFLKPWLTVCSVMACGWLVLALLFHWMVRRWR
ncbi:DUF2878 domain-containing protein [Enterobacteriaceae bacterium C34A]